MNSLIKDLFAIPFDKNLQHDLTKFNWEKIKIVFIDLYEKLKHPKEYSKEMSKKFANEYLKNYFLYLIISLRYNSYLEYNSHPDLIQPEISVMFNQFKSHSNILKTICFLSKIDPNFYSILKLSNNFLPDSFIDQTDIDNFLKNTKQLNVISSLGNLTERKILNIIIYRFVLSQNLSFGSYHEFYIRTNQMENLQMNQFINSIPTFKSILLLDIKKPILAIEINLMELIEFIIESFGYKDQILLLKQPEKPKEILIKFSDNKKILIDYSNPNYTIQMNTLEYAFPKIIEEDFLNQTQSLIQILLPLDIIKDYSILLNLIHLITIAIKQTQSSVKSIYEILYPIKYSDYYVDTFKIFLAFGLSKKLSSIKKYTLDILKYFYVYSYYDYYFYYSTKLTDTLLNKFQYKKEIFKEFLENLYQLMNLPKRFLHFPPFIPYEFDDINNLLYYSFEIPSYFKLYDCIIGIKKIFDPTDLNPNMNLDNIIQTYLLPKNTPIQKPIPKPISKPMSLPKEKTKMHFNNQYEELNIHNDIFILDTENIK